MIETAALLEQLKRYSSIKFFWCVPALGIGCIGTIGFAFSTIASIFLDIPALYPLVTCMFMVGGITTAVSVLLYTEKIRERIIQADILDFLRLFSSEYKAEKKSFLNHSILYYDVIDILMQKVSMGYHTRLSQPAADVYNCLYRLLHHDKRSNTGLAGQTVYENRAAFLEICDAILAQKDDMGPFNTGQIMDRYQALSLAAPAKREDRSSLAVTLHVKFKEALLAVKLFILGVCLLGFILQGSGVLDVASWLFNAVTVILLALEVITDYLERKANTL